MTPEEIDIRNHRRMELIGRIFSRVEVDEHGCFNWTGGDSGKGKGGGYGRISIDNTTSAVHLVVYTHFYGYIPSGKQVDHTCNNRRCCNPDHLELVSHKENQKRRAERQKANSCPKPTNAPQGKPESSSSTVLKQD